jgi:branched-chain amino acid transport system permease protein
MIVVTGGLGSITGSVLAGIVITILLEWLRIVENPIYFGDWELQGIPGMRMVVFSLALICIILFRREGFMGKREFNWDWVRQRFGNKAGRHAG